MSTQTKAKSAGEDVQDEVFETVRNGQTVVVDMFATWVDAVRALTPSVPAVGNFTAVPKLDEIVSSTYDIAEKSLATQREFVEKLVAAATNGLPKE
jgi:hypothetical protein